MNNSNKKIRLGLVNIRRPLAGVLGFLELYRNGSLKPTKKNMKQMENQILIVIGEINSLLALLPEPKKKPINKRAK